MSLKISLLTNKDYYNLTLDAATDLINLGERFTTIPNILMRVFSGFIFDIYGRRLTIYWFIILSGFAIVCTPLVAPSQSLFMLCICIISLFMTPATMSPLTQDYVIPEDQGKALAIGQMGLALGVVMSLTVLFTFIVKLDPIVGWGILATILISWGLITLGIISEPPEGLK